MNDQDTAAVKAHPLPARLIAVGQRPRRGIRSVHATLEDEQEQMLPLQGAVPEMI